MHQNHSENPFNALPPVVIALAVAITLPEIVFQLGSAGLIGGADGVGLRIEALNAFAFSPRLWDRMVELGQFPARALLRFVTYPFVHLGLGHMAFVLVFLLALGKMVGEIFAGWAVAVIFFLSAVFGAIIYGAIAGVDGALVGGYPAVYGLIGAYTFLMWTGLGTRGENRARAFTLIAFLLGIQLVFGAIFGGRPDWVADIAGFVAGFALSFVVAPGGWARILAKMRSR